MRKLRWIVSAVAFVLLAAAVMLFKNLEDNSCMGVPVVSPDKFYGYTLVENPDLNGQIEFNGEVAPVDVNTLTIYVTQQIENGTKISDLAGDLKVANGEHHLYFVKDEAFDNLYEAVKNNHKFCLMALNSKKEYIRFNVVFTALPVLKIDGGFFGDIDTGIPRYIGNIWLWDAIDANSNEYDVKHSEAFWHIRGNRQDKQSLKFSLMLNGENNDLSLMGLGKDDDWILNPLSIDDLKIREKITMDLWTQLQQYSTYPLPMSVGEYVELVHNGVYRGVWMLQRRIDRKYLDLGEDKILLKSLEHFEVETIDDVYEVEYSVYDTDYMTGLMQQLYNKEIYNHINLENWIDVALYIQMGCLKDNQDYKNMFFLFDMSKEEYEIYLLPWDTDMSFGETWTETPPSQSVEEVMERMEYKTLKALYPDLDRLMAQRWQQLRQNVFSTQNILAVTDKYAAYVQANGVVDRDYHVWNFRRGGSETVDGLKEYICQRMEFLDRYYQQYL